MMEHPSGSKEQAKYPSLQLNGKTRRRDMDVNAYETEAKRNEPAPGDTQPIS